MVNKGLVFSLGLLLACVVYVPYARPQQEKSQGSTTADQVNDSLIQLLRRDIRSQRKQLVAANLTLTDTEATKFWPLYDKYVVETVKLNDTRYALIKEYSDAYTSMTDAQADSYIKRWISNDESVSQLRLKWIPEFEKIISPKKTATFFQIDRRTGMMVDLQVASQIPLVQPPSQ